MQWNVAALVILALMISGCAGEGSATGERRMMNTKTGALAVAAPEVPVAGAAPEAPLTSAAPGGAVASTGPRVAGAAPGLAVAKAAPAAGIGPVAYKKNRTAGAIVGAVGGGLATGAVGAYMESQKQDLQKTLHEEIRSGSARVDKLPRNVVRIRMPSRTAFDTNSSSIKQGFCTTMDKVADVVIRYGKTTLTVVGHTDSKGSAKHNWKLSEQRALSIAQYLESKDVNPLRLATLGKGEADPIAANGTESGRKANRGVEIIVEPVLAK
jgi:outer membrane protein OmpA-like peptidoglycan-associated protein